MEETAVHIETSVHIGMILLGLIALGMLGYAVWQKQIGLAIGVSLAGLIHFGVLYGFNSKPVAPPPPVMETPKIEIVEMPPLEPEDELETVDLESDEAPPEFAPPTITDVPAVVSVAAVTVEFRPPPPDAPKSMGAITIPINRAAPAGGFGKIFDLKDLDQIPQPITQVAPQYPFEMKRQGQSGTVVVGFLVDSRGDVRDPYVVESTHREFEQAAVQAVSRWRFRPGRRQGRAVNTRMQIPIVFNIRDAI